MTPKEKAKDLFVRFSDYCSWDTFEEEQDYINNIKQCALIAVDEILKLESNNGYYFDGTNVTSISYWQEVKQEIDKL